MFPLHLRNGIQPTFSNVLIRPQEGQRTVEESPHFLGDGTVDALVEVRADIFVAALDLLLIVKRVGHVFGEVDGHLNIK